MKDRIVAIMNHEGLSYSKFAEMVGIQRSAMSHIISGRNKPSLDVLTKILDCFTYVNTDWLIFGKGSMITGNEVREPDLFTNLPVNPPNSKDNSENRREIGVQNRPNEPKLTVSEKVIIQKDESKIVTKIMLFYSDNTYDTFVPEKIKKD